MHQFVVFASLFAVADDNMPTIRNIFATPFSFSSNSFVILCMVFSFRSFSFHIFPILFTLHSLVYNTLDKCIVIQPICVHKFAIDFIDAIYYGFAEILQINTHFCYVDVIH